MTLHHGDCLDILPTLEAESVDAIVTDPPYGLGFMGKAWDHGAPGVAFWAAMLRVAKPGAHLLAFGGTRTVHRIACAIEDAGWEIRDTLVWAYASGFPKSLNVAKAVDDAIARAAVDQLRLLPDEERFCAWMRDNSGLTEADAGRILGSVRFITGEVEIVNTATVEEPRMGRRAMVPTAAAWAKVRPLLAVDPPDWVEALVKDPPKPGITHPGQWHAGKGEGTAGTNEWSGWGTALKPAWEPIVMARKPLRGTVAANVTEYGTGALNIDGCRMPALDADLTAIQRQADPSTFQGKGGNVQPTYSPLGRWPANVILTDPIFDGGEASYNPPGVFGQQRGDQPSNTAAPFAVRKDGDGVFGYGDSGTYSRFFLIPKAARSDREPVLSSGAGRVISVWGGDEDDLTPGKKSTVPRQNVHPTVKPTELMRHLVRLVTPPGGTVLDPFLGSGTTALACEAEGFGWIGIEREAEYVAIAEARLNGTQRGLGLVG